MTESSRRSPRPLDRAIELARRALAATPSGLLTDFDGTLSDVVAEPMLARLVEGGDGALARLVDRLAVVAVITGRSATVARHLVDVPGVLVVGNHGLEWLEADAAEPVALADVGTISAQLAALLQAVPDLPGRAIEEKGLSATIHYRGASDPKAARAAILAALGRVAASDIDVREGRMAVELRPRGLGDKGAAARTVVERHGLRGVVVMGDDVTDLDMFRASADMREAGLLEAAIIGVGGPEREVPPGVLAAADVALADPREAAALLAALSA